MSAGDAPDLGDYVEVRERIALFYVDHPAGRIVADDPVWMPDVPGGPGWLVTVSVYRGADPLEAPAGRGSSFLAVPGLTPYTRRSEVENAETSAAGRALALAGVAASRSIASADDVRRARAAEAAGPVGVPRAWAKGRLLEAAGGDRGVALAWWEASGLESLAEVPVPALEVLETLARADAAARAGEGVEGGGEGLEGDQVAAGPVVSPGGPGGPVEGDQRHQGDQVAAGEHQEGLDATAEARVRARAALDRARSAGDAGDAEGGRP